MAKYPSTLFSSTRVHRDSSTAETEGPSTALHTAIALHLITVQPINLLLMTVRLSIHQAWQTRRQSFIQVTAISCRCRCLQARAVTDTFTCSKRNPTTDSYFQLCNTETASENLPLWSSAAVGVGISSIPPITCSTASSWEQTSCFFFLPVNFG